MIDDVVGLFMLVGNDFLPNLPTLDIREGGLDKLLDAYKVCVRVCAMIRVGVRAFDMMRCVARIGMRCVFIRACELACDAFCS